MSYNKKRVAIQSSQPSFSANGRLTHRRWTAQEKQLLRRLFLDDRLPIANIAQRLNRSTASVNTHLTKWSIPRKRSVPTFIMPTKMTPPLARVHAHVCGDGHLFSWRERDDYGYLKMYKRGRYRWRYGFSYTNTNLALMQSFVDDVKAAFGLKAYRCDDSRAYAARVKTKEGWKWLKRLGAGGSRAWRIPQAILRAPKAVQAAWLKAFFDDEAHFTPEGGIRVRSVNRPGLEQARKMLRHFMPCHITPRRGLYPDTSCYLVVPVKYRRQFLRQIGSTKFNPHDQPHSKVVEDTCISQRSG